MSTLIRSLMVTAILLPVVSHVLFVVDIELSRRAPIEVDDAYAYLIKATQLFEVNPERSPAYLDLKSQLHTPPRNEQDAWVKYNERHRLTAVFSPLHSLTIAILKVLSGFSWEETYRFFGVVGAAFQAGAAMFLLYALFGLEAAAAAGILLTFMVFPHHGIHFVVPSTLAIASGFLAIGLQARKASPLVIFLSCLASVAFHPVGRIYVGMALLLSVVPLLKRRPTGPSIGPSIAAPATAGPSVVLAPLAALSLALFVPLFFPESMHFGRDPLPPGVSSWASLYMNLSSAKELLLGAFGGSLPFILMLALLGYLTLCASRRISVAPALCVGGAVLTASLFYVLPHFPAELFSRILVFVGIILLGFCGQGLIALLVGTAASVSLAFRARRGAPIRAIHLSALFLSVLLMGLLPALSAMMASANIEKTKVAQFAKERGDILFDTSTIEALRARTRGTDGILYPSEEPMHFGLMHGLAERGALYLPLIAGERSLDAVSHSLVPSTLAAKGALAFNPLFRSPHFHVQSAYTGLYETNTGFLRATQAGIRLNQGEWLEIDLANAPGIITSLSVEPAADGQSILTRALNLLPKGISMKFRGEDPDGKLCAGQSTCPGDHRAVCAVSRFCPNPVRRLIAQALSPIRVLGIRASPEGQRTNWPWDKRISVRVLDRNEAPITNQVELTSRIFPLPSRWEVIEDSGSLVALAPSIE